MINQVKQNPNPSSITKYTHKYDIPTNIPPTYTPQYQPHPINTDAYTTPSLPSTNTQPQPILYTNTNNNSNDNKQGVHEDEDLRNQGRKVQEPDMSELENQNTLAKLLMFDSGDLASRDNNVGAAVGRGISSRYYSINDNSSNGEKSGDKLNISNAVKYVSSRYQPSPLPETDANHPTANPVPLPSPPTSSPSQSQYPNLNNLPLFQSEYQYINPNPTPTPTINPNPQYQPMKKQNKTIPTYYTNPTTTNTIINTNTNTDINHYPYQQQHLQQQYRKTYGQEQIERWSAQQHREQIPPSLESSQSEDVLYTFLVKFNNIVGSKLRVEYRYAFQALYVNWKFKPFNITNDNLTNNNVNNSPGVNSSNTNGYVNNSVGYYQLANQREHDNQKSHSQQNNMYNYAIPKDINNNTYSYSHTSQTNPNPNNNTKSISLSLQKQKPHRSLQFPKQKQTQSLSQQKHAFTENKDKVKDNDNGNGNGKESIRSRELQSLPSHALSSISSIQQEGYGHHMGYTYNVSTSLGDHDRYEGTYRKHIFAIQEPTHTNLTYANQTYPHPHPTPKQPPSSSPSSHSSQSSSTPKPTTPTKSHLHRSPHTQTHPSPYNPYSYQGQHQVSPTFNKIIEEEQEESNTNTNSNIAASGYAGNLGEFQFNSNMRTKAKGKLRSKKEVTLEKQANYVAANQYIHNHNDAQSKSTKTLQPLSIKLHPRVPTTVAFPKADKTIQFHTHPSTPSNNPPKLQPLQTDTLKPNTADPTEQPSEHPYNSSQPNPSPYPYQQTYQYPQYPQYLQYQQYQQQQQQQQQNIHQQDRNPEYSLDFNCKNNTNNNNSNSKSKSGSNNSNKNIVNTNPNVGGLFHSHGGIGSVLNAYNNINTISHNKNNIQTNIQQIPDMNNNNIQNNNQNNNPININTNSNKIIDNYGSSDKIIQQQPVYIDVGQPLAYDKLLLNNRNISRSISSYIENKNNNQPNTNTNTNQTQNPNPNPNTNANANWRVDKGMAPEPRGQVNRPVTHNPTSTHITNIPVQTRPTSNLQHNINYSPIQPQPQILLKYPHIVIPTPKQPTPIIRQVIPIRFNSVSPPPIHQRPNSQPKIPLIKIHPQPQPQPHPLTQPKQIFITFNQDSTTRRPVSQPSPRPVSNLTKVNSRQSINLRPAIEQLDQEKERNRKLIQVRADYYGHGHDVRPVGNVVINNKVVRQVSPVLKEVRSSPQLVKVNFIQQDNPINNARIRNGSPSAPQHFYNIQPPIPIHRPVSPPPTIPLHQPHQSHQRQQLQQQSPTKTDPLSSIHSSLESNKLSNQPRPHSNILSSTPISTLKEVPFVRVEDVSRNQIIQQQKRMDQTFIGKLEDEEVRGSFKKNTDSNHTYYDTYHAPKKQHPQLQPLHPQPTPSKPTFNFPSSSTLHTSPPSHLRQQIFPPKQSKMPDQTNIHPIYREYHDNPYSRPGSNRKKLNLVSKEQVVESKVFGAGREREMEREREEEINDY